MCCFSGKKFKEYGWIFFRGLEIRLFFILKLKYCKNITCYWVREVSKYKGFLGVSELCIE